MNPQCSPDRAKSAFTLIELLVVIAIIALMISILLPSLTRARERGRVAYCLSNQRQIAAGCAAYLQDVENSTTPYLPWYVVPPLYPSVNLITPWIFAGIKAPKPAEWAGSPPKIADSSVYRAEERYVNKYITGVISESGQNSVFRCPSDRTHKTAIIGQAAVFTEEDRVSSFEANGNSYTLNTRWAQGYGWLSGTDFSPTEIFQSTWNREAYARRLTRHIIGGGSSRFVLVPEQGFYSATYRAGPTVNDNLAMPQRHGWHKEFSKWSLGFADGHAEYRYYDTRLSITPDATIWQPNWTTADGLPQ
ncbi:MAG: type II secretion system protein [Phycisphaerales bacterium]|nr:type II secretion system protein [Phycisphaerales bacterium]MCB9864956.1 type II secretion system protein [Phycisphaerales bacterium]